MKRNFWKNLREPFFVLAPMADVTDLAFRKMLVKYGKPDVSYTEFVSADGLCSEEGRKVLVKDLRFLEEERPVVAQIFGANPENIKNAVKLVEKLGFDGVDINMGCPDKAIVKQGAGAALMKNPSLARKIIASAKEGANKIPVSVKTRIGFNKIETEEWIGEILKEKPDCLIVHGRTKKEMSEVPAHWDEIAKAGKLAKENKVVFVGNGDITSLEEGRRISQEYQVPGIMIGRGVFGNPWVFNKRKMKINKREKIRAMLEHTKIFEEKMKGIKNFSVMKKHYKAYVNGFPGARELRKELMESNNFKEVEEIIRNNFDIKNNVF